jgi:hypothetical protein
VEDWNNGMMELRAKKILIIIGYVALCEGFYDIKPILPKLHHSSVPRCSLIV